MIFYKNLLLVGRSLWYFSAFPVLLLFSKANKHITVLPEMLL